MKTFAVTLCCALFATAWAASLELPENNRGIQKQSEDEKLRDALTVVCDAVEVWIENNKALEPREFEQRLERLVDEALEQTKLFAALEIQGESEEDGDSVSEYGLGKKLKKWKNKVKKALVDAAKVVAVNKAVGAVAGAMG